MKTHIGLGLILLAALTGACTNKQNETEAPVFITVDIQDQQGFVDISVPAPVQEAKIVLNSHLKNADATDPQGFGDVQLQNYTVTFRRTDGGTIVPPVQTFGGGGLLPSGGQATLNNFPVMYASTVQGTPFDQLLPFNGGIDRQTGRNEIDTAFDIVFYGITASGMRVASEPGSGILIFQYLGSAAAGARSKK